jgi:hypothetical protein
MKTETNNIIEINSYFNIDEIMNEIKDKKKILILFEEDNLTYITNLYIEWRKYMSNLNTQIRYKTFQLIVYYYFYNLYLIETHNYTDCNNKIINDYIRNSNAQFNNIDFTRFVDVIDANEYRYKQYTDYMNQVINEVLENKKHKKQNIESTQTPNLIKGADGNYYTQEQINNYEDIPI